MWGTVPCVTGCSEAGTWHVVVLVPLFKRPDLCYSHLGLFFQLRALWLRSSGYKISFIIVTRHLRNEGLLWLGNHRGGASTPADCRSRWGCRCSSCWLLSCRWQQSLASTTTLHAARLSSRGAVR